MVAKARLNILYSQKHEERSAWQKRLEQERALWIAAHPRVGMWTLLGPGPLEKRKATVLCRCDCGKKKTVAVADFKAGATKSCRSCAMRARMKREFAAHPIKMKRRVKEMAKIRAETNHSKYTKNQNLIAHILMGAKQRCTNKDNGAYENYGGRGIEFRFLSIEEATLWVWKNLGERPSTKHSMDRIDNNRHYEPGNLRWATRYEQARNKRQYKGHVHGYRIARLMKLRPDYSRQGLLRYVDRGWTDEQIITMKKPPGGRPRKC